MKYEVDNIYTKRFIYFNLYVITGKDGDILIDTGFVGIKKNLKQWLDNFNIKLIILTHAHIDHTWNVSYLKKLYNCEVAISELDISNIDNRNITSTPSTKKHTKWTKLMNWGMHHLIPPKFNIDIPLQENQIINKCGLELKVISLNGHTEGSIGLLYKDYLFAGDSLVNRRKQPTIAYQNQNNQKAIESGQKIANLNPKVIFVGHDKPIINNNYISNFSQN